MATTTPSAAPRRPASTDAVIEIRFAGPNGVPMRGVAALPDGPGPHPGVVVVCDVLGLTDDTRRACARLAEAGYAALAHDPYSRGPKALCVSRVLLDLARGTSDASLDDIAAAKAHLAGLPGVDGHRTAVLGFCMGGGFALAYAARRGGVRAASISYGKVPKERHELATVCPVVGSFGSLDKVFAGDATRLEDHLDALAVPHDVKLYDGVGHGFMNDHGDRVLLKLPSPMHPGFDAAASEDAWDRITAFFDRHVRDDGSVDVDAEDAS